MNKQDIFSIALRFFALILFLEVFRSIFRLLTIMAISPSAGGLSVLGYSNFIFEQQFILVVLYAAFGFGLFKYSDNIANKYIKEEGNEIASREQILQIAVAYSGLVTIISSSIGFFILVAKNIPYIFFDSVGSIMEYSSFIMPGAYLANIVIGILILLNYESITKFLIKIIPKQFWGEDR